MFNMPIREHPDDMLETVRGWDERMMDHDFLYQAKGWVMTNRTCREKHVFLPHQARKRGYLIR